MQEYVRSGIAILNDETKKLKNLNELVLYLSKATDINALKTLKLIILASETKRLEKNFDLNYVNKYLELEERGTGIKHYQKQNIVGNLAMNPQNFALELFEYISKNYPINWNFKCYGIYSIFELWERSLERMSYSDMDLFYKRYDMLDKKLDILDLAINNGSLTKTQIENLINTYSEIIEKDKNLTPIQIQRLINRTKELTQYNLLHKEISSIKGISKETRQKKHDAIDKIMGISKQTNNEIYENCKKNAEYEIQQYKIQNDQCCYMLYEIPRLIKSKIIK